MLGILDPQEKTTREAEEQIAGAAVVCWGVTKDFGAGDTRIQALRGVDLEVRPGELTLLVGPSGCGKTTLISIIAGLLNPTDGEIEVLGRDLGALSNAGLVRFRQEHIGFVFQQYNLLPALTAAENAAMRLLIAGHPRRQALAAAAEVRECVGLGDRRCNWHCRLGGGLERSV